MILFQGKITSLVGESGGGKSTVAKLVMRFYDPLRGEITIDGKDIKNYDLRWLHKQIGFVSQEPLLFAATIKENIIYGLQDKDKTISDQLIVDAAKKANAHDFIMSFPDKYDTVVGERGIRLSGGQKQRIAIARAILMNPRILLLDEATSALDSESEYLVQQALDRIMIGRSVLVIAHRLSTVKNAHQVVVIEKGKVVEIGTQYGCSAAWMAQALGKAGQLYTLEKDPQCLENSQKTFQHSDFIETGCHVELIEGDALEGLQKIEAKGPFDMVFIDANKSGYGHYLDWARNNIRKGGIIAIDNIYLFGTVFMDECPEKTPKKMCRLAIKKR